MNNCKECVARMTCLYKNNGAVSCVGAEFLFIWSLYLPRSHHHSRTRKGCQHVLMLLYIESIDGQFPIQTATHSLSIAFFDQDSLVVKIIKENVPGGLICSGFSTMYSRYP